MGYFNSYPDVLLHALLQDRHRFGRIVLHSLVVEAPAIATLNAINVHESLTPHLQHRVRATKRMFRTVGIRVIGRNDFRRLGSTTSNPEGAPIALALFQGLERNRCRIVASM